MICRPILLHNEFLPAIVGKRKWKYLALGHHDGMTIEDTFSIDSSAFYKKLFFLNAQYEGRKSDYSTQFFWGFHNDERAEDLFWKYETPFVFISFIQFKGRFLSQYKQYLESEQYLADEQRILQLKEAPAGIKATAYYTLDSNDIILVIKSQMHETGAKLINNLHQDIGDCHPFHIRNSYSVLALDREYIEDAVKTSKVGGNIEFLEFRIIERYGGSINPLYDTLKNNLLRDDIQSVMDRKALLGTEDESIALQNVPWTRLLPLYKEQEGALLNANSCAQESANAITSKILYSADTKKHTHEKKPLPDKVHTPFCDWLYRKIASIYKEKESEAARTEQKTLTMLVNALRKVEYSHYSDQPFHDYCFFTMMLPAAVFITLREYNSSDLTEYYDFIKYVKLSMQNFTKPDRMFLQIADFNIKYFDIPVKLVALYYAYLYYAKKLLNTGLDSEYEFLLCPGMSKMTEVKEFYKGTNWPHDAEEKPAEHLKVWHLFRVEIPEAHTYDPKLMIITLGHEVSHFVGRKIRGRANRYTCILKICGRMGAIALREYLSYTEKFHLDRIGDKAWEKIEERLSGWLKFYVDNYKNRRYLTYKEYNPEQADADRIDRQASYYELYYQHTSVLEKLLNDAFCDILASKSEELLGEIIWQDVNVALDDGEIAYEDRDRYYEKQKRQVLMCTDALRGKRDWQTSEFTIPNGIKEILYLLEECYADMCCILQLHLPLRDYLGNFIETLKMTGMGVEDVMQTHLIPRIAIVMAVMSQDISGAGHSSVNFTWENGEILYESEGDLYLLQEVARKFTVAYIQNNTPMKWSKRIGDGQCVDDDQKILKEIIRYLLKCRQKYNESVDPEEGQDVRRFFDLVGKIGSVDFFTETAAILDQYEQDIYCEMQKMAKEESDYDI